ncbi:hypothetical protein ESCO_006132 [Escovopsis weberi]|uniref:FAR1 domain-containing protein n=1 Tax=Escovopsis weberi TaxID=150374 RepID=A0A0M9VUT0_ESCWE|nr:hypothetical protein ESCO_006132 [Escovopsis weberi]
MPMEPPPTDRQFKDFDSAFRACQRHARRQGYALVKVRPCNYDNDGTPRRYDFACAYGGNRAHSSTSTGLRKSATRKTGCPFKMKVLQKRLLNNAWIIDVVCPDHNHGPDDPAKFPEHRVGSLRRRHFEKIKELSQDPKMSARAIRDALRADDPNTLVNEIDVANLLRELKAMEKEGEAGDRMAGGTRRRHRHFFNAADDEEESSPEPIPPPIVESSPEETDLHKTLLALVPKIVQETIAAMPMAAPQQVAAVAAAATARLRDVAMPQQGLQQWSQPQLQHQLQPQGQPQTPQQQQQQAHQQPHQQPQPQHQHQHQHQQQPDSCSPGPAMGYQQQQPAMPFYQSVESTPGRHMQGVGFGMLIPTPTHRQQESSG